MQRICPAPAATLVTLCVFGSWPHAHLAAQTAVDLLPEPSTEADGSTPDVCDPAPAIRTTHTSAGGQVHVLRQSCNGEHTLRILSGDATATQTPLLELRWMDGEDGWTLVGEPSDTEPTPLVLVRTSSLLTGCNPPPALDPHTWAGVERGLVRVTARFRPGATPLQTEGALAMDHFLADARVSFVSSDASIGFARSWGPPSAAGWTPWESESPAFAVLEAVSGVPLAGVTLDMSSGGPVDSALQVGNQRYSATLLPGSNTLLFPEPVEQACVVLTVAPTPDLAFSTLRPVTALDTRPLERSLRVMLLPELGARDGVAADQVSRVIASAGSGALPILLQELALAGEPLQSRLVDTIGRMDGGAAALLEAASHLELSDDARARIGRVFASDAAVAAGGLSELAAFPPQIQVSILRAAVADERSAGEVAAVLRGWLADETRRDDALQLAPDINVRVIQSLLAAYDLSDDSAETREMRIATLRLLSRADIGGSDGISVLAMDAMAARNGTEARLGIAVCGKLADDATCWAAVRELTDDPEPQLRADAWTALMARNMTWEHLTTALDDESPTVRLAAARASLRGAPDLDTTGWDAWLARVDRETWPTILRLHGTVLAASPAATVDRMLSLATRAGGADGAGIVRQLAVSGTTVPCTALMQSLSLVEPDAGATSVSLAAALMELASTCEGADGDLSALRAWEEAALTDGRLTEAYLSALAVQQPDAALQVLDRAFASEPSIHAAAVRALRWFDNDVRRRSAERWSASAPDDRSAWEWGQVRQQLGMDP